jgi:hypothetical protein
MVAADEAAAKTVTIREPVMKATVHFPEIPA